MKLKLQKFGKSLVSRDLAKSIAADFNPGREDIEKIELDFDGVDTVTPSFSHELLSNILEKDTLIKSVDFINTNSSIELQLKKALQSLQQEKQATKSESN